MRGVDGGANVEQKDVDRVIGFTDAALAITITLLMLDIRLPQPADGMSDGELWAALLAIWPRYLAYFISFVAIGIFWISHRGKFRWIVRADGALVWLNILFLLCLGLIPFVTGLIADNPGSVATMVYAGVMAVDLALMSALWVYATRAGLVAPALPANESRRIYWRSMYGVLVFGASIVVAWFQADVAKFMWLLLLLRPLMSGRRKSAPPRG